MEPMSKDTLLSWVEAQELPAVKVAVTDLDGILRGKYMSKDKFKSAVEQGFGFCDVVLGWDSSDQLLDNVTFTGWHTGYPDAEVRLVPETARKVVVADDEVFVLGEFVGRAEAICPRGTLRRVLQKASDMGYGVMAGFEYEFFVFDETPQTAAEKGYRNLKPLTPGSFGYSLLRNTLYSDFYQDLLAMGEQMRLDIEGLHTETGPGVLEAALSVTEGLEAADRAVMFKTFSKVLAQKNGLMATFMAKWNNSVPGQSGHLHLSLLDTKSGDNVFYKEGAAHSMSDAQRWFVGGQQKLLPELCAMVAPTVNSYTRLVPGFWAPINATWGVENRTCALRVIPGSKKAQRVEFRIGAADGNPYLVLAAALLAGLWGIEHKVEPGPMVEGNAYADPKGAPSLPATLFEAAGRLRGSEAARAGLGDAFVEHFAASREWEEREFRKHVTDWELKRYFEII